MRNKALFFTALLFAGTLLMAACSNNNNDDDDNGTSEIRYNSQISNLMTANCVGCHTGSTASAGLDLTTYTNVKASAESGELTARINDASNPMPPSALMAQANRDLVQSWIDGGYLE